MPPSVGHVILWFPSEDPLVVPVANEAGRATASAPTRARPVDVAIVTCAGWEDASTALRCGDALGATAAVVPVTVGPYLAVEVREGPACGWAEPCPRSRWPQGYAVFRFADGTSGLARVLTDADGTIEAQALEACPPAVCEPPPH